MNTDTFYFNGQELLEFSVVNIPSNPNAVKKNFGEQRSFTDYPQQATNNARRALQIRDGDNPQIQECGTRVGWTRANQLADREPLSEETVARMATFAGISKTQMATQLRSAALLCGCAGVAKLALHGQNKKWMS
jgi:hypothetical protein